MALSRLWTAQGFVHGSRRRANMFGFHSNWFSGHSRCVAAARSRGRTSRCALTVPLWKQTDRCEETLDKAVGHFIFMPYWRILLGANKCGCAAINIFDLSSRANLGSDWKTLSVSLAMLKVHDSTGISSRALSLWLRVVERRSSAFLYAPLVCV